MLHVSTTTLLGTSQYRPLHSQHSACPCTDGAAECTGKEATLLGILPKKRKFAAHVASLEDVPERAVSAGRTPCVARQLRRSRTRGCA